MNRVSWIKKNLNYFNPPIWWITTTQILNRSCSLSFGFNGILQNFLENLGFWFWRMNSSRYLGLINNLKIPKITLCNRPNSYLEVWWIYQYTLSTQSELAKFQAHPRLVNRQTVYPQKKVVLLLCGLGLILPMCGKLPYS